MKTVFEHIEYVKGKPHHVRERIAFATATGCTALIAFVWLAGSLRTGAFALKSSSFAESARQSPEAIVYDSGKSGLAGVAAALPDAANAPAHIEIVDTASSTPEKKAEQTIIPF